MQNAGIPPWQRSMWPLLICNNEVAAVAGVATASAYTVRAAPHAAEGRGERLLLPVETRLADQDRLCYATMTVESASA